MGPDCPQMSSARKFRSNRAWVENIRTWDSTADLANLLFAEKGRMALKIEMVLWTHRLWRAVEHATAVTSSGVRPGIARALSIIREDPARPISFGAQLAGVSLD